MDAGQHPHSPIRCMNDVVGSKQERNPRKNRLMKKKGKQY